MDRSLLHTVLRRFLNRLRQLTYLQLTFYKTTGATELSSVLEPSKKHGLPS
ncbi:hypothetical protein [Cognataquiflexum aquatile]|uniref:hypothetical protein n=1 Tax=Cognataquiflexum aquatile TaxID=2249427 RepID=UPI0013006AB3|nr:hypothetical protein [Cognataquiflexum aquatile]